MGRGGRGSGHQSFRRPVDLTGILSIAERNDLTTLVNAITEKMHNDISNIFDSPTITPVLGEQGHHHWHSLSLVQKRDGDKENELAAIPSAPRLPNAAGDGSMICSDAHQIGIKEEKEAMAPQLRELKKEALLFFRKWQNAIIQRTRELSITDPSAAASNPPRGRGARGARGSFRARSARGGSRNYRAMLTLATGPPRSPTSQMDRQLSNRYSPIPNTLWTLHVDKRKLLLHIVMLLVLSLQDFNANARVFLLHLTSSLNLSLAVYHIEELRISKALAKAALEFCPVDEAGQKMEEQKGPKRWKVGSGGSGPNTTISGSLKAAGIGAFDNGVSLSCIAVTGLLGPMADHGHLLGNLFGINAVRPTSKMLDTFLRDISDFAFLRLGGETHSEYRDAKEMPAENRRLRVVIAMGGCLSSSEDVTKPWRYLGSQTESYAVQWDVAALMNLGSALETVIKSTAWESAKRDIKSRSIFRSLVDSSWPVALLKVSKIIDNPWSWGMVRAEKAGALLADSLVRHKFQGERSVSLIGYGLAARSIYTCLMVLAERRQFGLIDSVVMIGTPAPSESRVWLTLKSVVTGRLVNVYSEQDFILGFLYRMSNIHFGVAGLQEIQGAHGVENHHVKQLPRGHLDYQNLTGQILRDIEWDGLDMNAIRVDQVQSQKAARRGRGRNRK
ncbi:DUF726 domain-containing protein [Drechmeria coniospora]|uniref:DUF726 domain-containing protein n=1 Tax=Drechmeria coniospora TaxID=98403 RepID=A0A151GF65_DRECN|nr:DUF726 domain-containing protein [Drechmeria coniospora]KYK55729.1 DUF726 domain-containing protein [Drechmeria coniospora]ODA81672.1 hypothetical protein RJ55_00174 [Drechmeria coniospora]